MLVISLLIIDKSCVMMQLNYLKIRRIPISIELQFHSLHHFVYNYTRFLMIIRYNIDGNLKAPV